MSSALYRHAGCVMHCDRESFSPSQTEERSSRLQSGYAAHQEAACRRRTPPEPPARSGSAGARPCTPLRHLGKAAAAASSGHQPSANALSACSEGLLTGESRSA